MRFTEWLQAVKNVRVEMDELERYRLLHGGGPAKKPAAPVKKKFDFRNPADRYRAAKEFRDEEKGRAPRFPQPHYNDRTDDGSPPTLA